MITALLTGSLIPSHEVAAWLLKTIRDFLDKLGLKHDEMTEEVIYVAAIVAMALFLGWAVRKIVLWIMRKLLKWRHTDWGEDMLRQHILSRCSHIIPPLVILGLLPFAFDTESLLLSLFRTGVIIYLIIVITMAVNTVIRFVWTTYDKKENTKNLPLGGILNICTGVVWVISVIIMGSVILDKSPAVLLTGLGAFAAALMLIFKDSILGFVAGVQLSQNDMPDMINAVIDLPGMKEFVDKVTKSGAFYDPGLATVNGTTQTNLGLMRAYMCYYLLHHPLIGTDQQILVRVMTPDGNGMPLQIYCYTTTAWTAYEAVQSEIFEHVAAICPKFGLRLYNAPSGNDVKSLRPEAS